MIEWIKQTWALGSVKLAAFAGLLAALFASNQTIALGLIYFLPDGALRLVVAAIIGLIVFVIPTVTQLMGKPKAKEKPEQEVEYDAAV